MVVEPQFPPGDNSTRQVGISHYSWIIVFILLCSSIALLPVETRYPDKTTNLGKPYWLYNQRDNNPTDENHEIEILFVGDVMLGRGISDQIDLFKKVSRMLVSADITVGNLEGVISDRDNQPPISGYAPGTMPFLLIAKPKATMLLQGAGFDLLSLANNHSMDMGGCGLKETIVRLERVGITTVGAGTSPEAAFRPVVFRVKGVRIAFLAINAIPTPLLSSTEEAGLEYVVATWDKKRVLSNVQEWREKSDVLVVLMHWGDEFEIRSGPNQRQAAMEIVQSGADIVIGSHPHVVQETQVVERSDKPANSFIAYSLGNFVFDQFQDNSRVGLALRLFINENGVQAVEALPVSASLTPEWILPTETQRLIERITPEPKWMSFNCTEITCFPEQNPKHFGDGLFKTGQIELNGDGAAETVRLEKGRALIYEGERLAWNSPPEWQILDAALGDPNDDGRGEILLILQKLDDKGVLTSHPFIIGHRGGIYRQVWGGSAVTIPVLEVELADLDEDGRQELIVLEEQKDGMNTIAVWKWRDWVYSIVWRSTLGRYRGLHISEGEDGKKTITIGQIW